MNNKYTTIYDFCLQNKVECTTGENGIYNCYINYAKGDRPWGNGTNIFDAIDNGVVNYLRSNASNLSQQRPVTTAQPVRLTDPKEMKKFFGTDGRIFWYWFAVKYNKTTIIDEYEQQARMLNPDLIETMRYLVATAELTIGDLKTKLYNGMPAIHNLWIQAIVFYESFNQELYENNSRIMDLVTKTNPEDQKAFNQIQKVIAKIDEEIQTIDG